MKVCFDSKTVIATRGGRSAWKKCGSENYPFKDGKILGYEDQEVQLKLSCKLVAILKEGGCWINSLGLTLPKLQQMDK